MIDDNEFLSLNDIINKELFEYILGLLANFVNCSTIGMSREGEFTNEINFTDFCKNIIRNNEFGCKACTECDKLISEQVAKTGKPHIHTCHTGLVDAAVPIFDGKNYLGSIVLGQLLFKEPDLEFCRQKAKEYGIDEQTYIEAIKKIPIVSEENFNNAIKQVESYCKALSNLASAKRLERTDKQKSKFILALLNSINSKKDVHRTLQSLVGEAAKLFDVDRILIVDFSKQIPEVDLDYFTPNKMREEDIEAIRSEEQNEWVLNAWQKEFQNKGTISVEEINDNEDSLVPELRVLYNGFGLKSALSTMIMSKGVEKVLVLENYTKNREWTKKDKSFLDLVAKEITVAINLAKMSKEIEQHIKILETLLNNMPFEIAMKNTHGQYIAVNNMFLRNCHLKREKVIGNIAANLFNEELAKQIKEEDEHVINSKTTFVREYSEKIGNTLKWFYIAIDPVLDKEGNVIGTIGYKTDVTDQKEVEQLKSEFISTVSHELRTPLTSIMGGLGLALSGAFGEIPPKIKTVLDISSNNTKRLHTLINDILDIDKLSHGKITYDYEIVELCKIIDEATKDLEDFAKRYKVNINYNAEVCGTLFLKVDKTRFIQILTNLLSNAIKYSDKGKDVEIFANALPNDKIRISVVNYGAEVPEDLRNRIYDRFAQADSSMERKKDSTGLGLSITHQLVTDMGGTIDYTSKNGKTVFFIEFDKASE